jgi:hypothetical protein
MQLRRALILFAVVLGLAALAASISQPQRGDERREPPPSPTIGTPGAAPGPEESETARLRFSERGEPATRELRAGRPAIVTVAVTGPGQVELEGLGLTASADPLTPARFDVLTDEPGRYLVRFTMAGRNESEVVGRLRVEPAT